MVKFLKFSKHSFESGKLGVKKSQLFSLEKLHELENLSFDELLKFLEEHGFREEIDTSYLSYQGFYLIEKILNDHLSKEYGDVFSISSTHLKSFLSSFYFKYQIHNFMVVVRCFDSGEKDISPYLIGNSFEKVKFLKAFEMPSKEDSFIYLAKKLSLDSTKVLEEYSKGIYYMENYLYSQYYSRLFSTKLRFNFLDEKKYLSSIKKTVDLLNVRTYLRLRIQELDSLNFSDFFVIGGKYTQSYFTSLDFLEFLEVISKLMEEFEVSSSCDAKNCLVEFDLLLSKQKKKFQSTLSSSSFGSPFYILKYFLDLEAQMNELRILLKSKYLGMEKKELHEVLS